MADIHKRLTDTLHPELAIRRGSLATWASHIADALLALPDIAVVELPDAEDFTWQIDDDFKVSTLELARVGETGAAPTVHPGCQITWGSLELNLVSHDARALAAVLLAATNAAERAATNG